MITKLSDELRLALEQVGGIPVHLVDTATNEGYVIMRADQYEKVKTVFERENHDFDPRETYPFVDEIMQDSGARVAMRPPADVIARMDLNSLCRGGERSSAITAES